LNYPKGYNTLNKMIIKSIKLSRLRKLELPDLAENVVAILEKYDSEALKIKESFDLLAEQQPQIDLLKLEYGPHLITKDLDALRAKRLTYVTLISLQMKVLSKADIDNSDNAVKIAQSAVDLYLKNSASNSQSIVHQRISEFFRVVELNEELETAFSTLGLVEYMNELRSAHSKIKVKLTQRKASIAARPNINIPPITQSVTAAIRNLFNQINLAQARNPELSYAQLISDLNVELSYFRGLISMRATILANKKSKSEEELENEAQGESKPDVTTEMDGTTQTMSFRGGVGDELNENGIIDPLLNIKKAAAKSSKHVQPPSIDNEDQSITS